MATYVDLLEEDKPIAQQKFVCVSFISPENIIQQKEHFLFDKFVKSWDLFKSMQKYAQFTAFLAYKYNLNTDQVTEDLNDFCKDHTDHFLRYTCPLMFFYSPQNEHVQHLTILRGFEVAAQSSFYLVGPIRGENHSLYSVRDRFVLQSFEYLKKAAHQTETCIQVLL
jgi:hypothetical protein